MKRRASAIWLGDLKSGQGTLSTERGVLDRVPYAFSTRFENDEAGTNPEELIGAAHAGCFSMALSKILAEEGLAPERIETEATVTLDMSEGPSITAVHLVTKAQIADADEETFRKCAEKAKDGCPVSRVLNAEITVDASLLT